MSFILKIIGIFLFSTLAFAKTFISPFSSSVDSLNIPNSHLVLENKKNNVKIYRSMAPVLPGNIESMKKTNIQKILIIKKDSKGEVKKEIKDLKKSGYTKNQIHQIPIEWKNVNLIKTCNQFVAGLEQVNDFYHNGKGNMLYHCTVGEDRTGILTGLSKMWFSKITNDSQIKKHFEEDLCRGGFGRGNPEKPFEKVVVPIRKNLTPLYVFLYEQIRRLKIQDQALTNEFCHKLSNKKLLKKVRQKAQNFKCQKQTL